MTRIIRGTLTVATGLLLTAVLAGQNSPPSTLPREAAVQIEARPAGQATAAIQAPATQSQAPAVQLEQTNPAAAQTPLVSVEVYDTSLSLLLSQIAQQSGLNLAMSQNLDRAVSVNLKDATLATALEAILPPENLHYQIDGKLLKVFKPQMVSATLNFNYITTVRQRSTSLSASATAGFSGGGAGGLGGGGGGGVAGGSSTSISGSENTDLPTKVEEMIRAMGTKGQGADIQYNKMLGQFFVTDYPENIARMKAILDQTQNAAGMQVYIEARLVEVQLNKVSQSGVNWSMVLGNTFSLTSNLAQQSAFQAAISYKGFDALISALSTYGDVNVLANPTVTTMNGQPAVVRIGTQDVFFITQTQTDPRSGQIIQTAETPATVNEGIVLDVTPNISPDGIIYMNIHPVVTERTSQATSAQGSTVPILDVRESDTAVHVADGDTIVIAGLIASKELKNVVRNPLSSIPILGGLFRNNKTEVKKTDLVIMLTPHLFPLSRVSEMTRDRMQTFEQDKQQFEKELGRKK